MSEDTKTIRIAVPRHLQDCNGYCGPACALMVVDFTGSAKSPPVFAQNDFFKEIRDYAKKSADKRPVKSPAESLLSLLNDHTSGTTKWEKVYDEKSHVVAEKILQAVEDEKLPCLMLVSNGMHWVVSFGMQKKDDGTPAGLLMRDPAWSGMPKFYGLSIFPEKPIMIHTASPCACIQCDEKNQQAGHVNERYFTMEELLSHRGLQGTPDWEGNGAIALVPQGLQAAALRIPTSMIASVGAAGVPVANAQEKAGSAALAAVREHGLCGRSDSPPEWNDALQNATAGYPVLVKDPDDSRNDFYLVPLKSPQSNKNAFVLLDARTLALREVSLLENWQLPAFPSDQKDQQKISQSNVVFADGTSAKFSANQIQANKNNLVWKPSAASILPYSPLKEFFVQHPITEAPTAIYMTQVGEVYGHLAAEEILPAKPQTMMQTPSSKWKYVAGMSLGLGMAAAALHFKPEKVSEPIVIEKIPTKEIEVLKNEITQRDEIITRMKNNEKDREKLHEQEVNVLQKHIDKLKFSIVEKEKQNVDLQKKIASQVDTIRGLEAMIEKSKNHIQDYANDDKRNEIISRDNTIRDLRAIIENLRKQKNPRDPINPRVEVVPNKPREN